MDLDMTDYIIILIQILWQIFDLHDLIITTLPDINPV